MARLAEAGHILLPLAVAALLFLPSLGDWFMMHDFIHLRGAAWHSDARYLKAVLDPRDGGESLFNTGQLYRPLYYLALLAQERLFGLDPLPYHLVNVGLHVLNVALVWWLARRLLGGRTLATLAALGYALHPLAVEAVVWISAITELLLAACTLGALVLWLESYRSQGKGAVLWRVGALVLAAGALLSREPGLAAPLAMAAYHLLRLGPRHWRTPSAWVPLLPLGGLVLGYVGLRLPHFREAAAGEASGLGSLGWHIFENLFLYLGWPLVPVWSGAPGWTVLRGLAAIGVLRLAEALLRRGDWRWAFLMLFWLLFALPYATNAPELQAGRYNYLLLAPLSILGAQVLAEAAAWLAPRLPRPAQGARSAVWVGALLALALPALVLHVYHQRNLHAVADSSRDLLVALQSQFPRLPAGAVLYVENAPPALLFAGSPFYLDPMVDLFYGVDVQVALGRPPMSGPSVYSFVYRPR
ncbi:MAG TPA: glycosyltransferase family 39 protein [Dehalococcoidia bacterium]|nr:glycosyltransferase family 39 protein [Dehalococcoidia bacterium]